MNQTFIVNKESGGRCTLGPEEDYRRDERRVDDRYDDRRPPGGWLQNSMGIFGELSTSNNMLVGGFKYFFSFTPIWGRLKKFDSYFSNGLVQPPTSIKVFLQIFEIEKLVKYGHPEPCLEMRQV